MKAGLDERFAADWRFGSGNRLVVDFDVIGAFHVGNLLGGTFAKQPVDNAGSEQNDKDHHVCWWDADMRAGDGANHQEHQKGH
jgi:hypothetical protein